MHRCEIQRLHFVDATFFDCLCTGQFADKGISFENNSRCIGALCIRAGRSCRRRGLPRSRKHERPARLLRRGVAAENRKIQGVEVVEKDAARSEYKDPLSGGGRPDHHQAEGHLSRLLKSSESDRFAFVASWRERHRKRKPGHWRANMTPIVQPAHHTRRHASGLCDDRRQQIRRRCRPRRQSRHQGAGRLRPAPPQLITFRLRQGHRHQRCAPAVSSPIFLPMSFPTSVEKR